jgi:putative ABC transport system substrate-binding protein
LELFFESLRDLGYAEGRNIEVHWQSSDNDVRRLADLAARLVASKVDLIVTIGTPAIRATQKATTTIPVLALSFQDPVGSGFAKSLARPGGNITGTTTLGEGTGVKRLELLVEMVPQVTRLAYLMNPDNTSLQASLAALEKFASRARKSLVVVHARAAADLDTAFAQIVRERAGAVLIASDSLFNDQLRRIGELALQHRLPSISGSGIRRIEHGLANYAQDGRRASRNAALMAIKIFKGEKPGDIPIEEPTHFVLTVNLKTAKALGVEIPPAIMIQATEVVR